MALGVYGPERTVIEKRQEGLSAGVRGGAVVTGRWRQPRTIAQAPVPYTSRPASCGRQLPCRLGRRCHSDS